MSPKHRVLCPQDAVNGTSARKRGQDGIKAGFCPVCLRPFKSGRRGKRFYGDRCRLPRWTLNDLRLALEAGEVDGLLEDVGQLRPGFDKDQGGGRDDEDG